MFNARNYIRPNSCIIANKGTGVEYHFTILPEEDLLPIDVICRVLYQRLLAQPCLTCSWKAVDYQTGNSTISRKNYINEYLIENQWQDLTCEALFVKKAMNYLYLTKKKLFLIICVKGRHDSIISKTMVAKYL